MFHLLNTYCELAAVGNVSRLALATTSYSSDTTVTVRQKMTLRYMYVSSASAINYENNYIET